MPQDEEKEAVEASAPVSEPVVDKKDSESEDDEASRRMAERIRQIVEKEKIAAELAVIEKQRKEAEEKAEAIRLESVRYDQERKLAQKREDYLVQQAEKERLEEIRIQ